VIRPYAKIGLSGLQKIAKAVDCQSRPRKQRECQRKLSNHQNALQSASSHP
jgi:hypothetical protein